MLNLLIAIMSDTFEKVMAEIEVSDGLELNNLILDAESLKIRNRTVVTKSVLHWVEYKTQNNKNWGGKSKTVTNALGATEAAMVKAITVQQERIQNLTSVMTGQTTLTNMKTDELSKKMDNLQQAIARIAKATGTEKEDPAKKQNSQGAASAKDDASVKDDGSVKEEG